MYFIYILLYLSGEGDLPTYLTFISLDRKSYKTLPYLTFLFNILLFFSHYLHHPPFLFIYPPIPFYSSHSISYLFHPIPSHRLNTPSNPLTQRNIHPPLWSLSLSPPTPFPHPPRHIKRLPLPNLSLSLRLLFLPLPPLPNTLTDTPSNHTIHNKQREKYYTDNCK